MKKFFLSVLAVVFLAVLQVFSQKVQQSGINLEQTVDYLNKHIGKDIKLELARKNMQLVINFYKGGVLYKIDRVYIETLDSAKVYYSFEEKALILRCRDAEELSGNLKKYRDGCIERIVMEKNIVGAYGRTTIDIGTDINKISSIKKAFVHLVKLTQDDDYVWPASFD